MQRIACLLFVKFVLISGTAEVVDAASSQFTSQHITRGTVLTHAFGTQIDTEYDEDIKKEAKRDVSEVDSNGLTLGITVGTQPMTLRSFGTQNIVMTEMPLKSFGTQLEVPSEVPREERLMDGLQSFGSQVSEPSEIPMEPSVGPEASKLPDNQPVTMSEAMVPHHEVAIEKPKQVPIVLSEAPIRHNWKNDIVVSEEPLSSLRDFGKGAAVTDPKLNPEWHLAWESSIIDTTGAPQTGQVGRPARLKGSRGQQRMAVESEEEQEVPLFERILDVWRICLFVTCIVCLAIEMCRPKRTPAKPLLRA